MMDDSIINAYCSITGPIPERHTDITSMPILLYMLLCLPFVQCVICAVGIDPYRRMCIGIQRYKIDA
jgi:hypothetical protein